MEIALRRRFPRPWYAGTCHPADLPPLAPADLSAAARTRLQRRAECRRRRIRPRRDCDDWYWLGCELALLLPHASAATRRRWRDYLDQAVRQAEWHLAELRALQAHARGEEPEPDAWLRRHLATLDGGHA
jgi:hypothetical protein